VFLFLRVLRVSVVVNFWNTKITKDTKRAVRSW
jgi:hypothetical protein